MNKMRECGWGRKLTVDGATKRSVAWKVWQFDDAGTRGVYGGGPANVAGIDQVEAIQI